MNTIPFEHMSVIQAIQLILAPGVMINACGLLLLGISSKFSSILNRIRALNEEKRKLVLHAADRDMHPLENQRIESIARQLKSLLMRAKLVQRALLCYFTAVGLFVITSMIIGADFFFPSSVSRYLVFGTFLTGMVLVFAGVVLAVLDAVRGYHIARFEVTVEE